MQVSYSLIYGILIHLNDVFTLLAIGLNDGILQVACCFLYWNNICQFKECRLHNHIDSVAQTDFLSDVCSIYDIEVYIVFSHVSLHGSRQMFFKFCFAPYAVKNECTALLKSLKQIILVYICLVVACDKVRFSNKVS